MKYSVDVDVTVSFSINIEVPDELATDEAELEKHLLTDVEEIDIDDWFDVYGAGRPDYSLTVNEWEEMPDDEVQYTVERNKWNELKLVAID